MAETALPVVVAAVLSYLLGAVPFGLVLTRLAGYGDIRKIGSGNIGTTNVLRTGNKPLAALTLLLDGGKGAAAVLLAGLWDPTLAAIAGAAAFLGHCFPVYLRFRGGKGVATGLGTLLAAAPLVGALACITWVAVAAAFRYSSLAGMSAIGLSPAYAWFLADRERAAMAAFLAVIVILRHHANIARLLRGEESRIRFRRATPDAGDG